MQIYPNICKININYAKIAKSKDKMKDRERSCIPGVQGTRVRYLFGNNPSLDIWYIVRVEGIINDKLL